MWELNLQIEKMEGSNSCQTHLNSKGLDSIFQVTYTIKFQCFIKYIIKAKFAVNINRFYLVLDKLKHLIQNPK